MAIPAIGCATSGAGRGAGPPDPLSRIESLARILVLEDSRSLGPASIQAFMQNPDPAVRRRAAVAAGRIGDPLAVSSLVELLRDPVVEVRRAAALALGLIGGPEGAEPLTRALLDADPLTRGRASEALGRIGLAVSGPPIAEAFRRALPPSAGVLRIRGDDPGSAGDPWIELRLHLFALARLKDAEALAAALLENGSVPRVDWWAAVWAAMRVADPRLTPILLAGVEAEDPYIRSLAVRGLGDLKDPSLRSRVTPLVSDRDPGVVVQALRALARMGASPGAAVATLVAQHLDSPNLTLRREALLALAALPPEPKLRSRVIENVGHPDAWIRSAAWPALIGIDSDDVSLVLAMIGPDPDFRVRQAVAGALGDTLGEHAAPLLAPMLEDNDPRVIPAVLSALGRAQGLASLPTLSAYARNKDAGVRASVAESVAYLEKEGESRFSDVLITVYEASLSDPGVEARLSVVDALAKHGNDERLAVLRRVAGSDPSRVVRQRALEAVSGGLAPAEATALRLADARRLVSVYEPGPAAVYSPRAVITTRHGKIELSLDLIDTPLTSMSFTRLAQSGFFNGLTFHRVVPGFVIQGGDPRGDGYGDPGLTIRCEASGKPYGRGSVGLALSGKDTGGSQFFITLDPQPHLDGLYTHFGQVLSGMEIVEKVRPGDVIESIEVFDGREGR